MGTTGRIEELLAVWERAADKPPPEQLCADCPELIDELRARIRARTTEAPPVADDDGNGRAESSTELVEPAPKQIGPYRIVALLGEGGMGSVYRAEQRSPIKRVVAIKVIKSGYDTKEVIARFESERQALARMDHPHIARVLEAGATVDTVRPYFVMEYVPGVPLPRFCDENKLSLPERLELFCQVCDAISHAHTKAIIHRDIKGSNVLGFIHDGKPTVKVIDFGIAKALTGDRLTDLTFVTDHGRAIGTYDSMSPEQADASPDIDTRTDVYSLGVLLYEILAGAKPFDRATLANAADHEIRRIIREVDPPRLDTRLGSLGAETATRVATLRQHSLAQLSEALRGELGWIPLKAMRKERSRRYESPRQLADDIQNYLERRPLLAGPESSAYRLRKWVSRYRYPIGGVLSSTLVLLIATVVSVYFAKTARQTARMETEQRRRADDNAALAEAHSKKLAEQAVQLNRQLADSYMQKAASLFDKGRRPQALLWIAKAIELEEKYPEARRSLARVSFATVLAQLPRMQDPQELPLEENPVVNGMSWEEIWGTREAGVALYLIDARTKKQLSKPIPVGRSSPVAALFSPDGRRLLTVLSTDAAQLWDVPSGEPLVPQFKCPAQARRAAFSDDGKRFVITGASAAHVHDTATAARELVLEVKNGGPSDANASSDARMIDARFSRDGNTIWTTLIDGKVITWDATTGRQRGEPFEVRGAVDLLEPSPDGRWLALRHDNALRVTLLDLVKYVPHMSIALPTASIDGMQFTADGNHVLLHGGSAEACVFRVADGSPVFPPRHLGWWPRKIWIGDEGGSFSVWDDIAICHYGPPTGMTPPMRHDHVDLYHANFSPDGTRIVTGGGGKTARVWDGATGQPITPWLMHEGNVRYAIFDPTGRRVLTSSAEKVARVFDARTGELALPPLPTPEGCRRAFFSPDGSRIAIGCEGAAVRLFDAATGKPLLSGPLFHRPWGTNEPVNAVAFSPDNRRLAMASSVGTTLWRLDGDAWTWITDVATTDFMKPVLMFTPDGARLLGRNGIFDGFTGERLVDFLQWSMEEDLSYAVLSPDGRLVAFADGTESTVRVVDVASGKIVSPLMPHGGRVKHVDFSRDGELLSTASEDNWARVFHARTGRLIASFEFTHDVQQASFSPDGKRLLVACDDGAATLWSLEPDPRPATDLRRLAEIMAWNVIDEFDSVISADGDALAKSWRELVDKYPRQFPKLTTMPTTRPVQ